MTTGNQFYKISIGSICNILKLNYFFLMLDSSGIQKYKYNRIIAMDDSSTKQEKKRVKVLSKDALQKNLNCNNVISLMEDVFVPRRNGLRMDRVIPFSQLEYALRSIVLSTNIGKYLLNIMRNNDDGKLTLLRSSFPLASRHEEFSYVVDCNIVDNSKNKKLVSPRLKKRKYIELVKDDEVNNNEEDDVVDYKGMDKYKEENFEKEVVDNTKSLIGIKDKKREYQMDKIFPIHSVAGNTNSMCRYTLFDQGHMRIDKCINEYNSSVCDMSCLLRRGDEAYSLNFQVKLVKNNPINTFKIYDTMSIITSSLLGVDEQLRSLGSTA